MKLSKSFTLRELTKSDTAIRKGIGNIPNDGEIEKLKALCENILQPARDHFGIPFAPNSGYRSAELCIAIGSKITSQHAKGEAVDFEIPTVSNYDLAVWIRDNLDFDQLILECYTMGEPSSGWVHCSYKADGSNRNEVLTYTRSTGYRRGLEG